jgi:hypothetical protein
MVLFFLVMIQFAHKVLTPQKILFKQPVMGQPLYWSQQTSVTAKIVQTRQIAIVASIFPN